MEKQRLHYYEQLAELYPTIGKASTEIINLQSILYLPKGTDFSIYMDDDAHADIQWCPCLRVFVGYTWGI